MYENIFCHMCGQAVCERCGCCYTTYCSNCSCAEQAEQRAEYLRERQEEEGWKTFTFGYDLDNVLLVEVYVNSAYYPEEFETITGRGDDVMNTLRIKERGNDKELRNLISNCDGKGSFEE